MTGSEGGIDALFTFEGDRGNEIRERPFRLLVLGDWSGDAEKAGVEKGRPIEIDRDNFDAVMRSLGTRLEMDLTGVGALQLAFDELDGFHPDQIFRRLPLFAELREMRARLLDPTDFNAAAREVRQMMEIGTAGTESVEEPSQQESAPSGDLLDAILSGQSSAASAPRRAESSGEIASLVGELVRPHLVSIDESEQAALLAAIDAATTDLMRRILHEHKFQALEAAWRGLYLLVRRAETGSDMTISILDISKDELCDNLKEVNNLADSELYRVLTAELGPKDEPWAVMVGNYAFSPDVNDTAALMRIARLAAGAGTPFISHIRPEILGMNSLAENADPSGWDLSASSEAGKLWWALRGIPECKFIAMTMPRVLVRLPYGRETDPLETFAFEELSETPRHDEYLWTNGSFVAGLLLAQTFSANGWQMSRNFVQDVERLPMHVYEQNGETIYQPCAEVLLTQEACERLMEHGLIPLVSYKNSDHVKLARFQSIADPVTGLNGRWS